MTDPGPALAKAAREMVAAASTRISGSDREHMALVALEAALDALPTEDDVYRLVADYVVATVDWDRAAALDALSALIPRREP